MDSLKRPEQQPRNSKKKSPPVVRRLSRLGRAQTAFIAMAMLMICSLVGSLVGPALIDAVANVDSSDSGNQTTNNAEVDVLETVLREAVRTHPEDSEAITNLATFLANTGNAPEAIDWFEKALALDPDDADTRLIFARTLADDRKPRDAELQFKRVIETDPNNAQAYYYLAELYRTWDPPRTADAIQQYQQVIAIGPDTYVADQSREELITLGGATPEVEVTPATPIPSP